MYITIYTYNHCIALHFSAHSKPSPPNHHIHKFFKTFKEYKLSHPAFGYRPSFGYHHRFPPPIANADNSVIHPTYDQIPSLSPPNTTTLLEASLSSTSATTQALTILQAWISRLGGNPKITLYKKIARFLLLNTQQ